MFLAVLGFCVAGVAIDTELNVAYCADNPAIYSYIGVDVESGVLGPFHFDSDCKVGVAVDSSTGVAYCGDNPAIQAQIDSDLEAGVFGPWHFKPN